jgi:hypothetical protein
MSALRTSDWTPRSPVVSATKFMARGGGTAAWSGGANAVSDLWSGAFSPRLNRPDVSDDDPISSRHRPRLGMDGCSARVGAREGSGSGASRCTTVVGGLAAPPCPCTPFEAQSLMFYHRAASLAPFS